MKLKCRDHKRRVVVISSSIHFVTTRHREDGTICQSPYLHIGNFTGTAFSVMVDSISGYFPIEGKLNETL